MKTSTQSLVISLKDFKTFQHDLIYWLENETGIFHFFFLHLNEYFIHTITKLSALF